jgi:acyl carrier protein
MADLLKRCSPDTLAAAIKFRESKDIQEIEPIVLGIIDRHLEPEQKEVFKNADDGTRLYEDLGLDSLTMLEIIMLVEQTLEISIDNEELKDLRTIGDVKEYLDAKVRGVQSQQGRKPSGSRKLLQLCPIGSPFSFWKKLRSMGMKPEVITKLLETNIS